MLYLRHQHHYFIITQMAMANMEATTFTALLIGVSLPALAAGMYTVKAASVCLIAGGWCK